MKQLLLAACVVVLCTGCWEKYSPGKHFNFQGEGGGKPKETPTDPVSVPEPATFLLLGAGMAGLALYGRKK